MHVLDNPVYPGVNKSVLCSVLFSALSGLLIKGVEDGELNEGFNWLHPEY